MQSLRIRTGLHALRLAVPLALLFLACGLSLTTNSLEAHNRSPYPLAPTGKFSERSILPTATSNLIDQVKVPIEAKLQRGETLAQILGRFGLSGAEIHAASTALSGRGELPRLHAGDRYSAFLNPDASLDSFQLTVGGSGRFGMVREGTRWTSSWQPFQRSSEVRTLHGTLADSLEASIHQAGGPPALAYRMADVLQWDLDFSKDLRQGDRFDVLYEEQQLDGAFHAVGTVYAVVYDNQGRHHEAYRYSDSGVYYDGEGRPLKKMFLRSPLRYSRITSMFSHSRFHPVLKEFRPHLGVDYGAPVGTPVEVTANGVVTFAGRDGGGGNVVKVQHPGGYLTAYLHLSRFASRIRPGARVRQGDVIAFTGQTGLATGPHLDYRVKSGDRWIDPLTLKGVRDEPIPAASLAAFRTWKGRLLDGMKSGVVPSLAFLAPRSSPAQLAAASIAGAARAGAAAQAR